MKYVIKISATSQNVTPIIRDVLCGLPADCDTVIEFEKGCYYFYREGSEQYAIYASGGKNVSNYVAFPVQGKTNLTINGNGSDFVFCDRMQPFLFQNCTGIRLENFSVDYSFLRYAYGTVTDASEEGFSLQMDKVKFCYFLENGNICFRCGEDVLSSRVRRISSKRIAPERSTIYHCHIGDTQTEPSGAAANVRMDAEEIPGGVFFRYRNDSPQVCYKQGDTICLAYDNSREAQAFWFENCSHITLEHVSIYRNGGMGFVADLCEDIRIRDLQIRVKPGREEYYTTTADGIFLTNCKGPFVLRDSYISNTYDDAINIHGFYTYVEEVLSDTQIRVVYRHDSHWGVIPCKVGDILHISHPEIFDELGTVEVQDVFISDDRSQMVLTLDSTAVLVPGMLLENPDRMPDVLIENNVVENCPHMRLSAGRMIIRDNRLALNDTDIYINDLIEFWGESGAVQDVQISGNQFGQAVGYNILVKSSRPETSNHLHQRIHIAQNSFALAREKALKISAVRKLTEENNAFGGEYYDQNS